MPENGRKVPRCAESLEVSFESEGMRFEGRISDLSTGGLYIDTINPLPKGATITFQFIIAGKNGESIITGEGIVAWESQFQGMGVRITRISEEDLRKLSDFLSA